MMLPLVVNLSFSNVFVEKFYPNIFKKFIDNSDDRPIKQIPNIASFLFVIATNKKIVHVAFNAFFQAKYWKYVKSNMIVDSHIIEDKSKEEGFQDIQFCTLIKSNYSEKNKFINIFNYLGICKKNTQDMLEELILRNELVDIDSKLYKQVNTKNFKENFVFYLALLFFNDNKEKFFENIKDLPLSDNMKSFFHRFKK